MLSSDQRRAVVLTWDTATQPGPWRVAVEGELAAADMTKPVNIYQPLGGELGSKENVLLHLNKLLLISPATE